MSDGLERLLLREKPTLALLAIQELDPAYAALVAKRIDSTFPHTISILSQLEEHGLITAHPQGRVRYLALTERGRKVALALADLKSALREQGKDWKKLDWVRRLVDEAESEAAHLPKEKAELRLGPLRRDLSRLKASQDAGLSREADVLDGQIVSLLRS
ncbi:MAG TPA: hypothetical protein VN455_03585 [Methanotrichaceae archaeon]|nr:hypothetical protein [Methanotrichaceae archaeon]